MLQSVQVAKHLFLVEKKKKKSKPQKKVSLGQEFQHSVKWKQNAKSRAENKAMNKFRYLSLTDGITDGS